MTIISYTTLKNKLANFFNQHKFIKRFDGGFKSELNNFANTNEKYPIAYMVPISQSIGPDISTFNIDVYCFDIVRDDKANTELVINQTNMVLIDFYIYLQQGTDYEIDILGEPTLETIENDLLDNASGWKGSYTIQIPTYCIDELPITDNL